MSYSIIQPPCTFQFSEMSKKELKDYAKWFYSILPERIDILAAAVKNTPGFEAWQADFTQESLSMLGEWFSKNIEVRSRTLEEKQAIENQLKFAIDIAGEELTNRTFSLAMDVGMYLSQVFLKNFPALKWDQEFGNKKNVDYGQPILKGFGLVALNPVWVVVTLAYGVVNKKKAGKSLRELYEIWERMIAEKKH